MILAHVYKLKPNNTQSDQMEQWLNMLRAFYNFCLRDRIETYEQALRPVLGNYSRLDNQAECCPLTCSVSKSSSVGYPWSNKGKKRNAGTQQDAYLPEMKAARPWYKQVNAEVLQMNVRRLNAAYSRFFDGLGGYPKFKRRSTFRSFSYRPIRVKIKENKTYLPGIGWMRFYLSRPIPEGFSIRTVTIRRRSDGWYMSVRLENKDVPNIKPIDTKQIKSAIAVDLGIKKLCALSNSELIANPNYALKVARRKRIRHRAASRKIKGSVNRRKAYLRIGRLDRKVSNQKADYHWKIANRLCNLGDVIIFEALQIKNMMARCKPKRCPETRKYLKNGQTAKRGLNRVIADAAWGELKLKTKAVAEKLGLIYLEVDPKFSSQECSCCGYVSPSNRDKEKFLCESCGFMSDADVQASINLLNRGLKTLGVSPTQLRGVPSKVTLQESCQKQETSPRLLGEPKNPEQLSLFEWRKDQAIGL